MLIGDDEHCWTPDGVFNIEGGCYAKCIDLKEENEPEIFRAIKFGSLCENVIIDPETRIPDYSDKSITENTRVGYPIEYIPNAQIPGVGGIPKVVIFLTADAFGVLPPISRLSREAAMYHFVTGFTSKLAGTERGITEPVPTFSTLFGEPFMPLDASVYAGMLGERIDKYGTQVYLVNTGWTGGPYGTGSRMKLKFTRAMVTAALNGELEKVAYKPLRSAPRMSVMISAIGVSYLLQNCALYFTGGLPQIYPNIPFLSKQIQIGTASTKMVTIITPIITIVLVILLVMLIKKTKIGMAMRAVSKDFETSELMGIKINNVISMTFVIGCGLAAVGSLLYFTNYTSVIPTSGSMPGLKAFVAAVFGGIGSVPGAVIGAFIIGICENIIKGLGWTAFSDAFTFVLLIVILLVKPTGIFGEKSTDKV